MDMEILPDYLVEAREMLEKAQEGTLLLEGEPGNQDALASVFRAVHTIKGGASFLDVGHLVDWAHHLESLLDKLRSGSLAVTSDRIDAVLKGLDVIDQMLPELAQGRPPAAGPAELGRLIRTVAAQESDDAEGDRESRPPEAAASTDSGQEKTVSHAPSGSRRAEMVENSLRIDALRLDAVMNQVGELVLLRNRLASAVSSLAKENEDMSRIAREMDLTVNDLQNTVMRLRMQPCKRLFQQLPRVVRDVSRQLGKDVRLEIVGEDVEIDKTVVDALSAPITHLVRNGLDHGIELPEIRTAANKPPPQCYASPPYTWGIRCVSRSPTMAAVSTAGSSSKRR
jgi:chemotaxis protein histidine kinase CheA